MKRLLISFCFLLFFNVVRAQNLKSQVVVLGNDQFTLAAATQAAKSGVSTIILNNLSAQDLIKELSLNSWLLKGLLDTNKNESNDKQNISSLLDSVKNLKVFNSVNWIKVDRTGSGWSIKLKDGRLVRAEVLLYGIKEDLSALLKFSPKTVSKKLNYEDNKYRTSVAGYFIDGGSNYSILKDFIPETEENLVLLNFEDVNMDIARAAGVIAAYAPFFKVKVSSTKLKPVQGEMLGFKSPIIAISDVFESDNNWRAIQNIVQTGILKLSINENGAYFEGNKPVSLKEISEPLKAYFYKARIWIEDHEAVELSIKKTVELIAYTRNKSVESLLSEIKKKWQSTYKFNGELSAERIITRREFAAITQDYLELEQVNIDNLGEVIR